MFLNLSITKGKTPILVKPLMSAKHSEQGYKDLLVTAEIGRGACTAL